MEFLSEISNTEILILCVTFLLGCILTALFSIMINGRRQKNIRANIDARHDIMWSIGKICSKIDNEYAAYRKGSFDIQTLRDKLKIHVGEVKSKLNVNESHLEQYYIKNIKTFISNQTAFIEGKVNLDEGNGRSDTRVFYPQEPKSEQPPVMDFEPQAQPKPAPMATPVPPTPQQQQPQQPVMPTPDPFANDFKSTQPTQEINNGGDFTVTFDNSQPQQNQGFPIPQSTDDNSQTHPFEFSATQEFVPTEETDIPFQGNQNPFEPAPEQQNNQFNFDNQQQAAFSNYNDDIGATQEFSVNDIMAAKSEDTPFAGNSGQNNNNMFFQSAPQDPNEFSGFPANAPLQNNNENQNHQMPEDYNNIFQSPQQGNQGQQYQQPQQQQQAQQNPQQQQRQNNDLISGDDIMDQMDNFFGFDKK